MSSTEISHKLVLEAMSGQTGALNALIEQVQSDLWGFLRGRLRRTEDAEDVYQETWMKVTKEIRNLRDPSRFRSWLFAIAINAVRSSTRRPRGLNFSIDATDDVDSFGEIQSHDPSPQQQTLAKERFEKVTRALHTLSDKQRETLLLEAVGDLPQKDIAELVGDNLNTVKTNIRRARIRLARKLVEVGLD